MFYGRVANGGNLTLSSVRKYCLKNICVKLSACTKESWTFYASDVS